MKFSRWVSLAAGCLVMASSGLSYSFNIVAPGVKDVFGFSDLQISMIASTISLGGYIAIISGLAYDAVKHRHNFGPRVCMLVGSVLMVVGYGGMWAQATGRIGKSYVRMLLCALLAGNAGTWWDTSILTTSIRNFPDDRGSVLGILKGFLGLSTSLYASIFWAAFAAMESPHAGVGVNTREAAAEGGMMRNATTSSVTEPWVVGAAGGSTAGCVAFLLFLAVVPSTLNLVGSIFINQVPHEYFALHGEVVEGRDGQRPYPTPLTHRSSRITKAMRLGALYCLVAVLAVFQACSALYSQGTKLDPDVQEASLGVLLLLLLLVLFLPATVGGPLATPSLRHQAAVAARELRHSERAATSPSHRSHHRSNSHHISMAIGPAGAVSELDLSSTSGSTAAGATWGAACEGVSEPLLRAPHRLDGSAHGPSAETGAEAGLHDQAVIRGEDDSWSDDGSESSEAESEVMPAAELSAGQAMGTAAFWVLFLQFLSGAASGLTLLNNMSAIVIALGGQRGGQVAFVSLFSVANAAGRLMFGHLSEHYLHTLGLPRTVFAVVVAALSATACAGLAMTHDLDPLYPLSLLCGFAFGGHWSTLPAVASDLFGLSGFASYYCLLQFAPAISGIGIASLIAGKVAAAAAADGADGVCLGRSCYGPTFAALAVLNLVTLVVCLWLLRNTRDKYTQIISRGVAGRNGHGRSGKV